MTEVTTDLILDTLEKWVEEKQAVSPHTWVDACLKLQVLMDREHDKFYYLFQKVAQIKESYMKEGDTHARARVKVEGSDTYREMKMQEAKIKKIEEMVRLAKIKARLTDEEYRRQ